MNRKLILLNVVLAAILFYAGYQWRAEYVAAKARTAKTLAPNPVTVTPPGFVPLPNQAPVMATGYNDVAQHMLLHPSRNPDIAPEPVAPLPPPPPMPPLPKYKGMMNLDGTPVAILSEKENAPFREVKPGDTIGLFKLVDVTTKDITFEWRNQQVRKTLDEILDRTVVETANSNVVTASANSAASAPVIKTQVGPVGDESQFHSKACDPNDSYANGSVVGGYRKVSTPTPFGPACQWQAVGK